MATKYTKEDLVNMSSESKDLLIISLQDQVDQLKESIEKLIEEVRIANQYRFGRHSEKMDVIDGQLSLFDEAETVFDESVDEPDLEDVLPPKRKGKKENLKERRKTIKPLVDEYFAWVKEVLSTMLPKGKTAEGLNYSINQEKQLRVFIEDGEVPIDNSASERSIRTFCVGKKNWLFFDFIKGANAGAAVYSVTETAKANKLHPYKYLEYLLTELSQLRDDKGNIDIEKLDPLMPWSPDLPDDVRKPERKEAD